MRNGSSSVRSRADCSVVFVGYAAEGTLARSIVDGARRVHLFGEVVPVRARVYTINGFSAHADQQELLAWHKQTGNPDLTILVHGEEKSMRSFAELLTEARIEMPAMGQQIEL